MDIYSVCMPTSAPRQEAGPPVFTIAWNDREYPMTTTPKTDRRRHPRANARLGAWLSFPGEAATRGAATRDLSLEGARFSTRRKVEIGTPVLIGLELRVDISPLECKGRVAWTRPNADGSYDFGVRFVDLQYNETESIRAFLDGRRRERVLAAV